MDAGARDTGASPAPDPVAAAMQALDAGPADELVIERPCFSTAGETEAVLLALWRLVRTGGDTAARGAATLLIEATRVDALLGAMRGTIRA